MSEPRSRRRDSDESKSEAVRRANDSGKPVTQVARELGVNAKVLHRWMRAGRRCQVYTFALSEPADAEMQMCKPDTELSNGWAKRRLHRPMLSS